MEEKKRNEAPAIHCGSANDDYEHLKALCHAEAEKLAAELAAETADAWEVPFWTEGLPELICVGTFWRTSDGTIAFELDFSQGTL